MFEKYNIPYEQAVTLSKNYVNDYGTTYKGLCHFYEVDEDEYFNFVHDIPVEDHLKYDPDLDFTLASLPGSKYILTNATSPHASRVLNVLKVSKYFSGIIDIKDMAPFCKPAVEAFKKSLEIAGNPHPAHCVFVDDLENNTLGAMKVGFHSILFGRSHINTNCHAAFENWGELGKYLREKNHAHR